jgi:transposase
MESTVFVGVDVSQDTLDIASEDATQIKVIANQGSAVRRWLKSLPNTALIGVESTGCLHQLLVREAITAGHTVYVLNARDLSHYARALGRRAKTDRLDALLIARYLKKEHDRLHPFKLPSPLQIKLDELIRRRHKIVVAHGAVRASLNSTQCKLKSAAALIRAFKSTLAEIDQQLQALVQQDQTLAVHAQNLRSVVGFGPLLSASLSHAITRHPFKNDDAFIAYVGYDPRVRDSGQLKGRRFLSKHGPSELRRLLFTAAMSACNSKLWRPVYQHYRDRGFSSTAALCILARKLARIAFSIVKYRTHFDPTRIKIPCAQP